MRLAGVGQRQGGMDRRDQPAGCKPVHDLAQHPRPRVGVGIVAVPGKTPDRRAFAEMGAHFGEQFLFRQARQRVERDNHAERRQHPQVVGEIRPDKLVENQIDPTTVRQFQNPVGDVAGGIIHGMRRPETGGKGAFGGRARACDHLDPLQPAQIDHRGADPAGGAVDVHRSDVRAACRFAQQAPRNRIIRNAHGGIEIDCAGQRRDDIGGHGIEFGMAAAAGPEHQHCLAEGKMADAGADADHIAGHFIADNCRQLRHPFIDPRPQQHVGLADAEGMRLDQDLAGSGHGIGQVDVIQDIGAARFRELYRLHADATFGFRLDNVTPAIITAPPIIWNIEIDSPRSGMPKIAAKTGVRYM